MKKFEDVQEIHEWIIAEYPDLEVRPLEYMQWLEIIESYHKFKTQNHE